MILFTLAAIFFLGLDLLAIFGKVKDYVTNDMEFFLNFCIGMFYGVSAQGVAVSQWKPITIRQETKKRKVLTEIIYLLALLVGAMISILMLHSHWDDMKTIIS